MSADWRAARVEEIRGLILGADAGIVEEVGEGEILQRSFSPVLLVQDRESDHSCHLKNLFKEAC